VNIVVSCNIAATSSCLNNGRGNVNKAFKIESKAADVNEIELRILTEKYRLLELISFKHYLK
jgi:hypothetical protein